MERDERIKWLKRELTLNLNRYELSYRFFEEGDFGSLSQVEFISKRIGGNVDFLGLGWLGVFVWSYETDQELLNVLIESGDEKEQEEALRRLQELLQG